MIFGDDDESSSLYYAIVPATCFGIFGLMVMAGLVHRVRPGPRCRRDRRAQ